MKTKTVTVVQRLSDDANQFGGWLRDAGYRVRVCCGPEAPAYDCYSYHFFDCPLWTQADLLLYDPNLSTGPNRFGSGGMLAQEHAHAPGKPILIWGSGGCIPLDVAAMEARGEAELLPADLDRATLLAVVERHIGPPKDTDAGATT